jgi:hypothetical protein
MGQPERGSQNTTVRTGQAEQGKLKRTDRTGLQAQDCCTVRKEQFEFKLKELIQVYEVTRDMVCYLKICSISHNDNLNSRLYKFTRFDTAFN